MMIRMIVMRMMRMMMVTVNVEVDACGADVTVHRNSLSSSAVSP